MLNDEKVSARGDDPEAVTSSAEEEDWEDLIERYQHIIDSVCRSFRLKAEDAADVSQTVWMKTFVNVTRIRERRALPGWIKTTAQHAACDVLRSRDRLTLFEDSSQDKPCSWSSLAPRHEDVDDGVLSAERRAAVRHALNELTEDRRVFLNLLVADPPVSYQQISEQLGLPVGSIGPTRARCLRKLAANTLIQALAA